VCLPEAEYVIKECIDKNPMAPLTNTHYSVLLGAQSAVIVFGKTRANPLQAA